MTCIRWFRIFLKNTLRMFSDGNFENSVNSEALETLRWVLREAESGFFIFIADSPELQREVALQLQAQDAAVFDYAATNERAYSYGVIEQWAKGYPDKNAYVVVNLHLALGRQEDIYNLNMSRDMLAGHKKIWIFGMTRETDDRLARGALDFYSFVRIRELFVGEKQESQTRPIEVISSYSDFTSAQQAEELIRAYRDMESEYMQIEVSENTPRERLLSAATTLMNLAGAYRFIAKYDKTLDILKKVLEICEKVLSTDHPDIATTYNNIAMVYRSQGDYDAALKMYEKALEIYEKMLSKDHPNTATTYNNIATIYDDQGDYGTALKMYAKVLEICEKVLGTDNLDTATTYNNVAMVYYNQENYDAALKMYAKALEIRERVLGKEHLNTAITYNDIAMVYYSQGDYDVALKLYKKALEIFEKVLGREHPNTATIYNNIAGVYNSQGDYNTAFELYKKALDIYEKVLGKEHPHTLLVRKNINDILERQKKLT